ncbi:signal recognition particle SPR19 [Cryptosporidium sp. chipmunk genotype I]|uniref:signal recognition particle SPR19 n=1 Tax=Cryptosporidium sp. chipmunk genotype I TaxID=1280935 RepID=UPI00351AB0C9|nr:signal recognition particle SPR19 [Cryptosporidium sp. chipmunk genotype I]
MGKERKAGDQDTSKWKVIYPSYLNSNNTKSGGRLSSLIHCVEDPTVAEIAEVCIQLGIPCKLESKRYPRDHRTLGRVRFQLFDDNGKAFNDRVLTKKVLLDQIGIMIPKLKNRHTKSSIMDNVNSRNNQVNTDEFQTENDSKIKETTNSATYNSANMHYNNGKSSSKKKK